MLCPICHKNEGEWQCKVCRRIVCTNDARPSSSGVYCVEHVPSAVKQSSDQKFPREESGSAKALKGAFFTMLVLTIGLGVIIYIGQIFVEQFASQAETSALSSIKYTLDSLQSVGNLIFYFMVFLTIVLGVGWLALRRQNS